MKRSSQVALVVMGVAATTAAGAYLLPSRADCRPAQQPAPQQAPSRLGLGDAPAVPATQPQPARADESCRRRSRGWLWYSGSRDRSTWTTRSTSSPSTAFSRQTTSAPTSTRPSTSTSPTTPRSGFGTTSRSISRSPGS
jgi:hypothetical protein